MLHEKILDVRGEVRDILRGEWAERCLTKIPETKRGSREPRIFNILALCLWRIASRRLPERKEGERRGVLRDRCHRCAAMYYAETRARGGRRDPSRKEERFPDAKRETRLRPLFLCRCSIASRRGNVVQVSMDRFVEREDARKFSPTLRKRWPISWLRPLIGLPIKLIASSPLCRRQDTIENVLANSTLWFLAARGASDLE